MSIRDDIPYLISIQWIIGVCPSNAHSIATIRLCWYFRGADKGGGDEEGRCGPVCQAAI